MLVCMLYYIYTESIFNSLVCSFSTNRVQRVKVSRILFSALSTNVGVPQGCVSVAVVLTSVCLKVDTDQTRPTHILKYSDDAVLISLLNSSGDPALHQRRVNEVVEWSDKQRSHR